LQDAQLDDGARVHNVHGDVARDVLRKQPMKLCPFRAATLERRIRRTG